ncbi:MAG: protein-(glutamine-N5) methyltransferase, release factor-specific [Flavobacteriaceae bacterium]|nr:protein-(glutamine-N5) methyltransferase, release factor-specific [Flavobacteriaceae bacterium]
MTLADFKNKMKSTLSSIYESDELNSIFFLTSEEFLQIPRSKILLADEIELDSKKQKLFLDALDRLKKNEPVQYILGKTAFMDLEFKVNSSVLIPRPETEELVRLMLKEDLDGKEILDIGTGSGCIPISLAKNLPNAKVSALDISEEALRVARENAKLNNVDIDFINADIFDYKSEKKYDVIVSNPPYVRESEKSLMKRNVVEYEPELALFVTDHNPLLYYKVILNFSKTSLNKNGKIYFEINENHSNKLNNLLENYDYRLIDFKLDFLNKNRFLILSK